MDTDGEGWNHEWIRMDTDGDAWNHWDIYRPKNVKSCIMNRKKVWYLVPNSNKMVSGILGAVHPI
ncbi:MAG: hypothetical protein B0D92_04895 [Spirochaeta sp. LUC14_002_19_P3]|nr:MAG: hypothetical protein B0D92_04895 [Spirochaeta sp. LUC14_002_19_P3]